MRFRDFHPNVQLRIIVAFVTSLIDSMIFPFMAIYFAKELGEELTGLLMIVMVSAGMVSAFVGGYYSDRIGRKSLMVGSETVFFLAFLVMAWAHSPWFPEPHLTPWVTAAMMLINGICWGIYGPASEAMLIDVTTSENRKYMYAIFYWSRNLSFAIGGMFGAFLFKAYKFELLMILTCTVFLSLLVTIFFISETWKPQDRRHGDAGTPAARNGMLDMLRSYVLVFRDSTFMVYVLASCLLLSTEFHLGNYIGVRLEKEFPGVQFSFQNLEFHLDGMNVLGFLRTENTLLVVLLGYWVSRLFKKAKEKWVFFLGSFLYVLGYSVVAWSNHMGILLAFMFLATLGEVMYVPIKQAYLGDLAPNHARSAYMAVNGLVYRGAMILASLAITVGAYLSSVTMSLVFFLNGIFALLLFYRMMPSLEMRREMARREEPLEAGIEA